MCLDRFMKIINRDSFDRAEKSTETFRPSKVPQPNFFLISKVFNTRNDTSAFC